VRAVVVVMVVVVILTTTTTTMTTMLFYDAKNMINMIKKTKIHHAVGGLFYHLRFDCQSITIHASTSKAAKLPDVNPSPTAQINCDTKRTLKLTVPPPLRRSHQQSTGAYKPKNS
jgi:hypothetical protein